MPSGKWFRRRPQSPVTPTMPSPLEHRYPLPPYISPTKNKRKMKPRKESTTATEASYFQFAGDYGLSGTRSTVSLIQDKGPPIASNSPPTSGTDCKTFEDYDELASESSFTFVCTESGSVVSSRPCTPRRDSDTFYDHDAYQRTVEEAVEEHTPVLRTGPDGWDDLQLRCTTPTSVPHPSLNLSPPDQTWHSVVAAWQIMRFAQRYGFDLVYLAHIYRDANSGRPLALSKFQTRYKPVTGQLLASYGLHRLSSPLKLPLHETLLQDEYTEYRREPADPNNLSYGQIYTFYRSVYNPLGSVHLDHHPYFSLSQPNRRIDRGLVFAAYRTAKEGKKLSEELVEQFVKDVVDLYLSNGLKSLLLDPRSEGAEILGLTVGS